MTVTVPLSCTPQVSPSKELDRVPRVMGSRCMAGGGAVEEDVHCEEDAGLGGSCIPQRQDAIGVERMDAKLLEKQGEHDYKEV